MENIWTKVLDNEIKFGVLSKVAPTKGNLVYEYNPFRNYRLTTYKFEYNNQLYSLKELYDNFNIYPKLTRAIIYSIGSVKYYDFVNSDKVLVFYDQDDSIVRVYLNLQSLTENSTLPVTTDFYVYDNIIYQLIATYKYDEENPDSDSDNDIKQLIKEENSLDLSKFAYYKDIYTVSYPFTTEVKDKDENSTQVSHTNSKVSKILGNKNNIIFWDISLNEDNIELYEELCTNYSDNIFAALKEADISTWNNATTYDDEEDSTLTNISMYYPGELVDFETDELSFSINNPVSMIAQPSYDGSVNLVINDGLNIPRLINSRFSATGRNTYEVIDRKGNNDTNIYDQGSQFDVDTSLFKRVTQIPKITFNGVTAGGNLKIGNYHFYFKFADADGNETDFVGESGLVSVFIGFNDYSSIQTGERDENSFKCVKFTVTNIDSAYQYMHVYYSRSSAENNQSATIEYGKFEKNFLVNNVQTCICNITGFETITKLSVEDINPFYQVVDSVVTQTTCQNMLFLGNVHKPDINYNELADLSLRFLPYLSDEEYGVDLDQEYTISTTNLGYIDPEFIYNKVGYWEGEIYRLGIVYLLPDGELSPVFNIRGAQDVLSNGFEYTNVPVYDANNERKYISYNEETYYIIEDDAKPLENVKGVLTLSSTQDTDIIHSINIKVKTEVIEELKKYVKGFFFVRQKRIPLVLAQGITIGIDRESGTPTIPTANGFLDDLSDSLEDTYVETEDIDGVNFISEGFLNRYSFTLEKKSSSLFSKILKATAITVGVCALAAACVFTAGAAAAAAAGATLASSVAAGAAALASVATAIAGFVGVAGVAAAVAGTAAGAAAVAAGAAVISAGAAIATSLAIIGVATGVVATSVAVSMASAGVAQEVRYALSRAHSKVELKGKNTEIPSGYYRKETDDSRKLSQDFLERIIIKDQNANLNCGILCPDYELNQPYYNSIFTGNEHLIETTNTQSINKLNELGSNYFSNDERHFYIPSYYDSLSHSTYTYRVIPVTDNMKCAGIEDLVFRARAGEAEEAWRYEGIDEDYKSDSVKGTSVEDEETISNKKINTDIVRGSFGPYLAINNVNNKLGVAETVNIYVPGYSSSNMDNYFRLRMEDKSTFEAISYRYDINDIDNYSDKTYISNNISEYNFNVYRGDCYLCQFTHRVNRNFNDPSSPYNDEIVDEDTWKDNYDPENSEKYEDINLGDVNAVKLGMWCTFRVRSSNNLNIRTLDESNTDESLMTGHPRGYYPYHSMSVEGSYKHPEAQVYNKGFQKALSERYNYEVPDVPYIKNWFGTRIMYSDIHINDAYKNGYRVFQGTHYRDYTREYGEIVKLLTLNSDLICVFEHAVALIPVNERAVAGEGTGGNVYINTSNVLPENPKIISDVFGSQWAESVIKSPGKFGDSKTYIYGVDTVAKKIWRTDGNSLQCISDFKVQEFLNNNITLGERELTPIMGIRNVKTFYNAYKRDVLFTFYDNTYGFEECVWNLCWNELLERFITFYSWVPSAMENINNVPFSFNRNTTKWIAKLGTSHTGSSFADGITLTNSVINNSVDSEGWYVDNKKFDIQFVDQSGELITKTYKITENSTNGYIGMLSLSNRVLPDYTYFYTVDFALEHDNFLNYKYFDIVKFDGTIVDIDTNEELTINNGEFKLYKNGKFITDPSYIPKYGDKTIPLECLVFNYDYPIEIKIITVYELPSQEDGEAIDEWAIYKLLTKIELGSTEEIIQSDYETTYLIWDSTSKEYKKVSNDKEELDESNEYLIEFREKYRKKLFPRLLMSELYYRNKAYHSYSDSDNYKTSTTDLITVKDEYFDYPIFKNTYGQRLTLDNPINDTNIVTLLNVRAIINIDTSDANEKSVNDAYWDNAYSWSEDTAKTGSNYYSSVVAVTPKWNIQFLSEDFWKHGQAGIIDIADKIYPTYWYGMQHPFEFEFIVNADIDKHKIFDNLEIISNSAEPESFHYEVTGDCYDFAVDKENMYVRQEATKELFQYNGMDIVFDHDYTEVEEKHRPIYDDNLNETGEYDKSTLLPLWYARQDKINTIEDYYHLKDGSSSSRDFSSMAGGEVVRYNTLGEFRIWNHAQAVDMIEKGRIHGNMHYREDKWYVQINPLNIVQYNEPSWDGNKIPAELGQQPVPDFSFTTLEIPRETSIVGDTETEITDGWKDRGYTSWNWADVNDDIIKHSEAKLKDKWIKIRIRYSGKRLAVISAIKTLYSISYS